MWGGGTATVRAGPAGRCAESPGLTDWEERPGEGTEAGAGLGADLV